MKGQLSTLTSALATVTQEKSRMEASFQADKRQLKQEMEELQECLVAMTAQQEAELHSLQQQLAESRARIITQQHEREQEQVDHVQQLRELQKILQQERDLRQDAELRLQEVNATLLMTSQAVDRGAESQAHLNKTREERDELRKRLQAAEEDQKKPDPRVDELQQELTQLKNHFQQQIHIETKKVKLRPDPPTPRSKLTMTDPHRDHLTVYSVYRFRSRGAPIPFFSKRVRVFSVVYLLIPIFLPQKELSGYRCTGFIF